MTASTTLHTLDNGVRVVHDPMPGLETIALSVVAGRGAAYEDPSRSGWSHLLEHMVFKGAGNRTSRDIVEVIESQGGQINAATGYERTSFQVRALKGGLDLGMSVLSDLVLRPTLDEGDLTREKQVVAQEIAEAADAPDDYVFDLVQAAAWGDHPLARPILGTVDSVNAATVEGLAHWRGRLYAADRLIVSASGAVELDEVLDLARVLALQQRGQGGRQRIHRAAEVGHRQAEALRRASAGHARNREHAGRAEVVDVVPRQVGPRPLLAIAAERHVDQPRKLRAQAVGIEPQPRHHAGPVRLHHHVGRGDQRAHLGALQVGQLQQDRRGRDWPNTAGRSGPRPR